MLLRFGFHFLEHVGRLFLVERGEKGGLRVVVEVFDYIGEVGRMHGRYLRRFLRELYAGISGVHSLAIVPQYKTARNVFTETLEQNPERFCEA